MDTPPPPPPLQALPPPVAPSTPPPLPGRHPVLLWPRVAAALVDLALGWAVAAVVVVGLLLVLRVGGAAGLLPGAVELVLLAFAVQVLAGLAVWAAHVAFLHLRGATPGKMLLRLEVVDDGGRFPTWSRALGRVLLIGILGPISLIGLLHGDRRAYHDLAFGLHVRRRPPA